METVEAAEQENTSQIIYESADLIYHLLVMWKKFGLSPDDIFSELESREGKTGIRK
jgi:phosphoribosyl-ATP pyrophosphohydrolase